MTYTIAQNPAHNSLEITFDGKPGQAVRDALKALRFRWHGVKKLWYGYADESAARAAIDAAAAGEPQPQAAEQAAEKPAESKPMPVRDPALLAKLRDVLAQVWPNNEKWIADKLDDTAELVELSNGLFISIGKRRIETRFCFGESGYDADEAAREAHVARTSEEYFFNENMREYRRTLEILNTGEHSYVRYMPCLINYYTGNSTYRTMKFLSVGDVLEALGGSGDLEAIKGTFIPGERFTSSGTPVYVCNDEDIARLCDGYERAMNAHEKKVRAYLKRYGLSKVRSWTYWRDA